MIIDGREDDREQELNVISDHELITGEVRDNGDLKVDIMSGMYDQCLCSESRNMC
jgi:hypothetical protein